VWLRGCRAHPWPAVVVGEVWERIGRVHPTGATFGRRDGGHGGLAEKGTCIAKAGEVELSPPRHRPHTVRYPTQASTTHHIAAMSTVPPPPQWVLDINSTPAKPKNASLPDPPGYTAAMTKKERAQSSKTARKPPTAEEMDTLKMKKAWEVAIAPAKQLPMNAFGASYATQEVTTVTNNARHVHDGQHAPDLLHLHGLHTLQVASPSGPRHTTHIRPLRNTRHIRTPDSRQNCLYSL
jgi:hypothetical protein